ncbi:hypothetical protein [Nostoc commune]|uniref:hypothetical protein n=1 Tax=Nostoc commune TaxID=1178 RepID=UPI002B1EB399|nr:hypothetical protein [Nostoc commune]
MDRDALSTQYRIDVLSRLPLEPLEYCQRWVEVSPDERGYRKACVAALAEATALSPRPINDWGLILKSVLTTFYTSSEWRIC